MNPSWLFVGSGNLSWHILSIVTSYNHSECYLSSRNTTTKKEFLEYFTTVQDVTKLTHSPECIWICVKDSEITTVSEYWSIQYPEAIQIHCSGATSIEVLQSNKKMVWYPLQSFTKGQMLDWTTIPVFIESNVELPISMEHFHLHQQINITKINFDQRLKIHLAAVMSANFTTHLLHLAELFLQENNLSISILEPLVMSSIQKSFSIGPAKALTGPAIRRDEETIKKHIALLSANPDMGKLYTMLTESIQKNN
jgi:predicted short-subunit dehydrogenase-like oxidoreductase (DUF2520 family)